MKHLCVIPFSGFYNTLHDSELDDALNQMFSDRDTGCHVHESLMMRAWDKMNWRQVHVDYSKEYCEDFANAFKLDLTFDELKSPREYNFVGDRLFAYITTQSLRKVWEETDTPMLRQKIRDNHTSRDGFYSFYPNTLEEWPSDVLEWDHNQIATLIGTYADQELGDVDGYTQYRELDVMEATRSNGHLDDILHQNCPEMERLCKVHEYLGLRAERVGVAA